MTKAKTKTKRTTSSRSSKRQAQDNVDGQVSESVVQQASTSKSPKQEKERMSDTEELGSIVEFSEDVADQEAPVPLPASEYEATIKGVEAKVSTTSGKKYAAVQFYIGTDQYPADYPVENNPDGVLITYRMVPLEDTPQSRFRLKRFMEAIGAKPGKRIDISEWVGLTAKVGTSVDEYEGVPRENISKVSAL